VAIAWGLVCGALRAPAWMVMPGGLGAAALGVRLEWTALTQPVARRTINQRVLIAAAFGFLALVGVGIASLGCIVGLELAARLRLR
jgi:hypothetical protein